MDYRDDPETFEYLRDECDEEATRYDDAGMLMEGNVLLVFLDVKLANARANEVWQSIAQKHPGYDLEDDEDDEDEDCDGNADGDGGENETEDDGDGVEKMCDGTILPDKAETRDVDVAAYCVEMDGSVRIRKTQRFQFPTNALEGHIVSTVVVEVRPAMVRGLAPSPSP